MWRQLLLYLVLGDAKDVEPSHSTGLPSTWHTVYRTRSQEIDDMRLPRNVTRRRAVHRISNAVPKATTSAGRAPTGNSNRYMAAAPAATYHQVNRIWMSRWE
jgi:hypothetical protein